jgi:hypothetical protein
MWKLKEEENENWLHIILWSIDSIKLVVAREKPYLPYTGLSNNNFSNC